VLDFADAFNELKISLDALTKNGSGGSKAGPLFADQGMRDMRRQLARLTSTPLSSGPAPNTLAEIGVRTARDGSLSVDTAGAGQGAEGQSRRRRSAVQPGPAQLEPARPDHQCDGQDQARHVPDRQYRRRPATERQDRRQAAVSIAGVLYGSGVTSASGLAFTVAPGVTSATITVDAGLNGALGAIRSGLRGANGALTTSNSSLVAEQKALAATASRWSAVPPPMSPSFSAASPGSMPASSGFKATQAYLTQQVALWTKDS
jgi:flagellar hook-associated protein 2